MDTYIIARFGVGEDFRILRVKMALHSLLRAVAPGLMMSRCQ